MCCLATGRARSMAVPAHDERDLEFARKFDLPILGKLFNHRETKIAIGFTG